MDEANKALEEKMDRMIALLESIDWKLWIYLKANKYLADEGNDRDGI